MPSSSSTRSSTSRALGAAEPGSQAIARRDLDRDADIVGDRQLGKNLGDLERARHAAPHALSGESAVMSSSLELDRAGSRREKAADRD